MEIVRTSTNILAAPPQDVYNSFLKLRPSFELCRNLKKSCLCTQINPLRSSISQNQNIIVKSCTHLKKNTIVKIIQSISFFRINVSFCLLIVKKEGTSSQILLSGCNKQIYELLFLSQLYLYIKPQTPDRFFMLVDFQWNIGAIIGGHSFWVKDWCK